MRTANHIALIKLRMEGIDLRHMKRVRQWKSDARWVVFGSQGTPIFAFRSPSEALANFHDGTFGASYLVWEY